MLQAPPRPLGAPGVFALPDLRPPRLHPQRLDAAAFVGVAPRGPARVPVVDGRWGAGWQRVIEAGRPLQATVPVPVRSFDEYRAVFGGFEGPGLLAHAVASYFEQGARLAWVLRIVPRRAADGSASRFDTDCARGSVPPGAIDQPLAFIARNPGRWGDALRVELAYDTEALDFDDDGSTLLLPPNAPIAVGSTLRLRGADGEDRLARCTALARRRGPDSPREHWQATLEPPLPDAARPLRRLEQVLLQLTASDGAGRIERLTRLALVPDHPRSLASVLADESMLLWPDPAWAGTPLWPGAVEVEALRSVSTAFAGGDDRWGDITAEDFFDPRVVPEVEDETPGAGLSALPQAPGATQLVLPDLYVPAAFAEVEPVPAEPPGAAGAAFAECITLDGQPGLAPGLPSLLTGLILDPRTEAGLQAVIALQQRMVEHCQRSADHIALLDVPPGLTPARIERWRAAFDSAWAAAYQPWLVPARRPGEVGGQRLLPPSAVAAGQIARREFDDGIQHGPAMRAGAQVLALAPRDAGADRSGHALAERLHPLGVNSWRREPGGIVLSGARTLARDAQWRQLSVRRLVLMLCRALRVQLQWSVFEPDGPALRGALQQAIESLLRGLFRAGAFAGRSEAESFFVRVADVQPARLDGTLVVDIGVAPAQPLEFVLVRLRRDGDGTLGFEA
jgi:uncharacterized protein